MTLWCSFFFYFIQCGSQCLNAYYCHLHCWSEFRLPTASQSCVLPGCKPLFCLYSFIEWLKLKRFLFRHSLNGHITNSLSVLYYYTYFCLNIRISLFSIKSYRRHNVVLTKYIWNTFTIKLNSCWLNVRLRFLIFFYLIIM